MRSIIIATLQNVANTTRYGLDCESKIKAGPKQNRLYIFCLSRPEIS